MPYILEFWLQVYKIPALLVFVHMNIAFIVATLKRDNSVADIAWGLGFVVAGYTAFLLQPEVTVHDYISLTMVTLWGLRLAGQIYLRNRGKDEDFRYKEMREKWGDKALLYSYFKVFMLQGLLLLVIASPLLLIQSTSEATFGILDGLAVLIWSVGFAFEAISDWQLYNFTQDKKNKGKLLTTGLWRYSRHPNYFGEVTQWWAIFLLAIGHPYSGLAIIGPAVITYSILKVSGIPLLEEKMEGKKGFKKYKKETSIFIPRPPKK